MISFFVPGVPVPQGRARAFTRPGMKGVRFYDPGKSKDWKSVVASHVPKGTMPYQRDVPLVLTVEFLCKAPKALGPNHHHIKKPDLDNLIKAVKDALKGICWHDDSQVTEIKASKHYALPGEEGVEVSIAAIL